LENGWALITRGECDEEETFCTPGERPKPVGGDYKSKEAIAVKSRIKIYPHSPLPNLRLEDEE